MDELNYIDHEFDPVIKVVPIEKLRRLKKPMKISRIVKKSV